MIFIIDTSGSMGGTSIEQARAGLTEALGKLGQQDRFNIVEFNSITRPFYSNSREASAQNINDAIKRVGQLGAGGGTEMFSALSTAFNYPEQEGYVKQIVFITDGAVGNEKQLFKLIHEQLGKSRLFTVGIGSAPNSYFMRKSAEFGRGVFTHIGNTHEVSQKMSSLFNKIQKPVLGDVNLSWTDSSQTNKPINKHLPEVYPANLPDLYQGQPLIITAMSKSLPDAVTLTAYSGSPGKSGQESWSRSLRLNTPAQHQGVASLWAQNKIGQLLDEGVKGKNKELVRKDVLKVALTHQLISPYTSFVAVEKKSSRPKNEQLDSRPVPNARPKGQSLQPFAYPKTATSSPMMIMAGLLIILLSGLWVVFINQLPDSRFMSGFSVTRS
jgi:Ca-activated chloride channel family protein